MINKNSRVRFSKRIQQVPYSMIVADVKIENGIRMVKIENNWWPETSFVLDMEWKKNQKG